MKRRNRIVSGLALISGLVLTQSGAAGAETLQNTGFETYTTNNGIADGWVGYQPSTASGGYQVVESPVYEGMRAQRFAFGNMGMLQKSHVEQLFDIEPGSEYEVSGYFNIETLYRSYMQLMVEYFDADGNLVDSNVTNQVQRTNGYVRFQNIKVANTKAVYCRVSVGLLATADGASGAFTVDKIALRKTGDVLENAGFEEYHGMYDVADTWRFGYSPGAAHSQKVVTSPVASGNFAQKVSASGLPYWGYAHVVQVVTAHPGESYTVTGKFNIEELNGSKVQLYVDYYDANYKHLGSDLFDQRKVTNGYVQVTNKTRAPRDCAFFQIWALLRSTSNNGSGTFYVDDMGVTSSTYIPPEQPVVDLTGTISGTSTAKLGAGTGQGSKTGKPATANLVVNTDGTWTSEYNFDTPTVVRDYAIQPSPGVDLSQEAKDWTLEGFDGNAWVVLDTQTDVTDWEADTAKTYLLDNKQAYWQYRLNVSANNGDARDLDLDTVSLNGYYDRPITPLDVWNSDKGDGTVTLSWSPSNGVTSYKIYQDEQLVKTLPADTTTVTLNGLTNNRVYHYTVSAVNGAGESLKSPEVVAMPYNTAQSLNPIVTNNWSSNTPTATFTYDFAKPTRVREYTIKPGLDGKHAPKNWTFEGFDGLQWVELDRQSDITQWPTKQRRCFTVDNTQSFLKYRLKLSTDYGTVSPLKKNDIQLIGN